MTTKLTVAPESGEMVVQREKRKEKRVSHFPFFVPWMDSENEK